jgi:type I restriction enzyme S subunit
VKAALGEITLDKVAQGAPPADRDFTYVDISSVDNEAKAITNPKRLPGGAAPTRARQHVRPGDVLVSLTRPNLNAVALVPAELNGAIASTGFDVLRTEFVDPKWVFALVRSREFVSSISARVQGALYPAVRPNDVRDYEIPLPPLPEQRRIVARIEDLQARSRRAREGLDVLPQLLPKLRQSVLAAAFRGELTADWRARNPDVEPASVLLKRIRSERRRQWEEAELGKMRAKGKEPRDDRWKQRYEEPAPIDASELPELPEGWDWICVEELASREPRSIQSGPFGSNLLHSEFQDTGILAIGIDNVHQSGFSLGNQNRIRPEKYQELIKYSARPLDVLITVMASVGRACVVPADLEPAIITKHIYRITTDQQLINPHLLVFALQGSEAILGQVSAGIRGQTRPGINGAILKSLAVPVPPREEQEQIVTFISSLLDRFRPLVNLITEAKERTESLDRSILAKALRGELVPQDPSDEPASVLLERIRAKKVMDTRPRSRNHMRKQSAVRSSKKRRPILEVLNSSQEPLTPEELFARCGRNPLVIEDIEGFFSELRELEKLEQLEEVRPNDVTVLLRTVT